MKCRLRRGIISLVCEALQLRFETLFGRDRIFQIPFNYLYAGFRHDPFEHLTEWTVRLERGFREIVYS